MLRDFIGLFFFHAAGAVLQTDELLGLRFWSAIFRLPVSIIERIVLPFLDVFLRVGSFLCR